MSRWLKTCALCRSVTSRDDRGVAHEVTVKRRVCCNPFSMGAQSYYQAANAGVHPVAVIQLHKCDYLGERLIEYDNAKLNVDHIDASSTDYVVLTLTERTGDHG